MKNILVLVIVFLFVCTSTAYSLEISRYEFTFDIKSPDNVREELLMTFNDANITNFIFKFSNEIKDITVYENSELVSYSLEKSEDGYLLKVPILHKDGELKIFVSTNNLVYSSEDEHVFVVSLAIPQKIKANISVILPEGCIISNKGYIPSIGILKTDGKRISIVWNGMEGNINIMINFKKLDKNGSYVIPLLLVFAWLLFIGIYYHKKKSLENLLSGFDEYEQRVIKYLMKNKVCYQRDIVSVFGINKVKVSRILKKLESKRMINREKVGRKIKVYWKG